MDVQEKIDLKNMGIARRVKRQQERDRRKMIERIHRETMERFKHMTEEEIKNEIEAFNQAVKQNESGLLQNEQ